MVKQQQAIKQIKFTSASHFRIDISQFNSKIFPVSHFPLDVTVAARSKTKILCRITKTSLSNIVRHLEHTEKSITH